MLPLLGPLGSAGIGSTLRMVGTPVMAGAVQIGRVSAIGPRYRTDCVEIELDLDAEPGPNVDEMIAYAREDAREDGAADALDSLIEEKVPQAFSALSPARIRGMLEEAHVEALATDEALVAFVDLISKRVITSLADF